MVDVDRILTDEEIIMLKEAEKEFDEKKTVNIEEITRGSEWSLRYIWAVGVINADSKHW